ILMGVTDPKGKWLAQDSLDQLTLTTPTNELAIVSGARPDVVAAEAELHKAEAEVALQKALRIPDPSFSFFYEHNPPGPPGPDTVGLGVSFPLPLWNHNRGNIRAAEAAKEQTAQNLGKVNAQAHGDLVSAAVAFQEARTRLQRYQEQILPRS